jgi:hypothetical protein
VLVVEVIDASDTVVAEEIAPSTPITPATVFGTTTNSICSRQQSTDRSIANRQPVRPWNVPVVFHRRSTVEYDPVQDTYMLETSTAVEVIAVIAGFV